MQSSKMSFLPLHLREQLSNHDIIVDNAMRPIVSISETFQRQLDIPPLATWKSKYDRAVRVKRQRRRCPNRLLSPTSTTVDPFPSRWEAVITTRNGSPSTLKKPSVKFDDIAPFGLQGMLMLQQHNRKRLANNTAPLRRPVRRDSIEQFPEDLMEKLSIQDGKFDFDNHPMFCVGGGCDNRHEESKVRKEPALRKPLRKASFEYGGVEGDRRDSHMDTASILSAALSLTNVAAFRCVDV